MAQRQCCGTRRGAAAAARRHAVTDLTPPAARAQESALLGASARAGGALQRLSLANHRYTDTSELEEQVEAGQGGPEMCSMLREALEAGHARAGPGALTLAALLRCVRGNPFLAELDVRRTFRKPWSLKQLEALLCAGGRLRALHATAGLTGAEGRRLRSEPLFRPLRFSHLAVSYGDPGHFAGWWGEAAEEVPGSEEETAALLAHLAAAEAAARPYAVRAAPFEKLELTEACLRSPAALAALRAFAFAVGGVAAKLKLQSCSLDCGLVAPLAEIVALRSPRTLLLDCARAPAALLPEAAHAARLGAALAAARGLSKLQLAGVGLWRAAGAAEALLRCLEGHPSLVHLDLSANAAAADAERWRAGHLLASLLAASPRLEVLILDDCGLGDEALSPLAEAVGAHARLRSLSLCGNGASPEFAAERLLPAARACASLASLCVSDDGESLFAEGFVSGRAEERKRGCAALKGGGAGRVGSDSNLAA